MQSLQELFRFGMGPSSSHTMGPRRAAEMFGGRHPQAHSVKVTLYGSLSLTGKGHLTDLAVIEGLKPLACEVEWNEAFLPFHPNGMRFEARDAGGNITDAWRVFSVGGGELGEENGPGTEVPSIYPCDTMDKILDWADREGKPLWNMAYEIEGKALWEHLRLAWMKMRDAVQAGLSMEGSLPGGLHLQRKAANTLVKAKRLREGERRTALISAYALAVAEHNAGGGEVVTAPTCGSCGVLPAVLFYLQQEMKHSDGAILNALAAAGLVGNVVKKNASISGAEVGCQGEVGVACAMTAAAAAQLMGGSPHQIEYAAEIGMEHHLGLTCDPIFGLVQIPCIERNVFAALTALACAEYALLSDGRHLVSFDQAVEVMKQTGRDLPSLYRETSLGGLAKLFGGGCVRKDAS